MEKLEQDNIRTRLRSPPVRDGTSITGLVARYLPEIQEARQNGKTWIMIGQDLQPENPVKGDTIRRTVERATTNRGRKGKVVRKSCAAKAATPETTQPQLALTPAGTLNNPFGRKVDPIRHDNVKG